MQGGADAVVGVAQVHVKVGDCAKPVPYRAHKLADIICRIVGVCKEEDVEKIYMQFMKPVLLGYLLIRMVLQQKGVPCHTWR